MFYANIAVGDDVVAFKMIIILVKSDTDDDDDGGDGNYCESSVPLCCMYNIYNPHRRGGGYIVSATDPVGVGVSVSIRVTLSCSNDIS